jgi:dTDP-4-amino-4,6-dideoxygalactose transaminase
LAILRAGLKIEACDINSHNFNFNYQDLRAICQKNNDILAIIPAYLGGMPLEFDILKKIAGEHEIFIIEDCAQALGATYKGMKVGTLGDFAFFSLARGKGLTIYEGGAIAINNKEYFSIFNKKLEELVKSDFFSESLKFLELLGYFVFYRPCLFWFVYRLPEIFWNLQGRHLKAISEYFSLDFPVHKVSKIRRFIGHLGFRRLEEEIDKQREKAFLYMEGLREIKGVNVIKESPDSRATYPFLTLIFDDPDRRQKILKILGNSGLGVSELYTLPISDYAYLSQEFSNKHLLGAHYLAKRQLILSTSIFLGKKDIGRILDILSSSLRG